MNPHDYTFVDPCEAFQHAVNAGYLTSYPTADRMVWAGNYMYMGTCRVQGHAFKHIDTRRYLYVPITSTEDGGAL